MSKQRKYVVINIIAFIFLIGTSVIFARSGNTLNDGSVNPLFMPAGYAFSIWSLIYILLAVWILKGVNPTASEQLMYENVGYWLAASMIFSGLTISVPLEYTVVMIVLALITAIVAYLRVDESEVSKLYRIPFSFLVGWLSVATIVNISLFLKSQGITELLGINEIGWTILMLAIGGILALLFSSRQQDYIYPLVFIWAYIAIAVKRTDVPSIQYMAVITSLVLGAWIVYNIAQMYLQKDEA